MTDTYSPPSAFGGYVDVAGVIGATAAGQIAVMKAQIENLFGPPASPESGAAHPDFNKIPPSVRAALFVEIDAMFAAIAAAPTS